MLVLKLRRIGKKRQPSYRLIVGERRSKLNGRYVDDLGWYNPRAKERQFNKERVLYWLERGAQKTDTVHNLLIRTGIISGKKIAVHKKTKVDQAVNLKEKTMNTNELINQVPADEPLEGRPAEQPVEMPARPEMPGEESVPEAPAEAPAGAPVSDEPATPPNEEKKW